MNETLDAIKKKIFVACEPAVGWGGDVVSYALCEDGKCLASHISSSDYWAQHDMGFTSNWKHKEYAEHCPEGFELEWVEDPENHPGWLAAYALNQELAKAEGNG
jgi:hypothetical protein